jgi:hypothetical protein
MDGGFLLLDIYINLEEMTLPLRKIAKKEATEYHISIMKLQLPLDDG